MWTAQPILNHRLLHPQQSWRQAAAEGGAAAAGSLFGCPAAVKRGCHNSAPGAAAVAAAAACSVGAGQGRQRRCRAQRRWTFSAPGTCPAPTAGAAPVARSPVQQPPGTDQRSSRPLQAASIHALKLCLVAPAAHALRSRGSLAIPLKRPPRARKDEKGLTVPSSNTACGTHHLARQSCSPGATVNPAGR